MTRLNLILVFITVFCLSLSVVLFIENRGLRAESAQWCATGDKAVILLGKYLTALQECEDRYQAQANLFEQEATP